MRVRDYEEHNARRPSVHRQRLPDRVRRLAATALAEDAATLTGLTVVAGDGVVIPPSIEADSITRVPVLSERLITLPESTDLLFVLEGGVVSGGTQSQPALINGGTVVVGDGGVIGDNAFIFNSTSAERLPLVVGAGGEIGNRLSAFNRVVFVEGAIGSGFDALDDSTINLLEGGSIGFGFEAREGSFLNISGGTIGSGFRADGSNVSISGGTIAPGARLADTTLRILDGADVGSDLFVLDGSKVKMSGGKLADGFFAFPGTVVTISGGKVGNGFLAFTGSHVGISGGEIGGGFDALVGSVVDISGGNTGVGFEARSGSTVNISGGRIDPLFRAEATSQVTLFVESVSLDGTSIELPAGGGLEIEERTGVLAGTLHDGSEFSIDLGGTVGGQLLVSEDATLIVELVPGE